MNIIGLGKAGCKIAELFKQYSQYTVFKMDTDEKLKRKKNCFHIPRQGSAELYDANPIDLKRLKSNIDEDDVYFITCGSGKVSACSLWILKEISSQKKVNIVYIKPDTTSIDNKSKLRNRAHFHILQEYTRSGVFEKMFIFDNNNMPNIIGKTSILNYFTKINEFVVSSIHWYNIYTNTDPVFDTYREEYISSRICTFALIDIDQQSIAKTYSIEKVNQVKYFFGVNRITIESDEELLDKLTQITTPDTENISTMYGVYPTDLDQGFSLALFSSSDIQSE